MQCPELHLPTAPPLGPPSRLQDVPRLDLSTTPARAGSWDNTLSIKIDGLTLLGGGDFTTWLFDRRKRTLYRQRHDLTKGQVQRALRLGPGREIVHAVSLQGDIALIVQRRDSTLPVAQARVEKLLVLRADGNTLIDRALDWGETTVRELRFVPSFGGFAVGATISGEVNLGGAPHRSANGGQLDVLMTTTSDGTIRSVAELEDTVPGSLRRFAALNDEIWAMAELREETSGLGLLLAATGADGPQRFTRAVRWRSSSSLLDELQFVGPLAAVGGVYFVGSLSGLDWGSGPLGSRDSTMIVSLDAAGNVRSATSLSEVTESAGTANHEIVLLTRTATSGFRLVALADDGTPSWTWSEEGLPPGCDGVLGASLQLDFNGVVRVAARCEHYVSASPDSPFTTLHFATIRP